MPDETPSAHMKGTGLAFAFAVSKLAAIEAAASDMTEAMACVLQFIGGFNSGDLVEDRAYVVAPVTLVYTMKGTPKKLPGMFTVSLRRMTNGWRIAA